MRHASPAPWQVLRREDCPQPPSSGLGGTMSWIKPTGSSDTCGNRKYYCPLHFPPWQVLRREDCPQPPSSGLGGTPQGGGGHRRVGPALRGADVSGQGRPAGPGLGALC